MIDTKLLRKIADKLDEQYSKVDIGQLNIDIREATVQLLMWQNLSRKIAVQLVDLAYTIGT